MKSDKWRAVAAVAGIVVFAVLAAGSMDSGSNTGSGAGGNQTPASESSEVAQSAMPVGSVGHLKSTGGASFSMVARTKADWEEFSKLISARDTDGMQLMVLQDKLMMVDGGTKVRVLSIDTWAGTSEVRILQGKHYGASGWVFSRLVVR